MLRLLPAAVDGRLIRDDDEISSKFGGEGESSKFGGEGDFYHPIVQDSVSGESTDDEDDSSSVSDCESVISGRRIVDDSKVEPEVGYNGLVRLDETDKIHEIIEKKFISRLNVHGVNAQVECIHRNLFSANPMTLARLRSFQIFTKALEKRNGGDANIKYAWFGASKDEIDKIMLHGFGHDQIEKNGSFGYGVVLSADNSPLESVESATVDDDGVRHILLCRVLLGKTEVVNHVSTQWHPSSEEFHSGVDDLVSPKKFVVWSTQMNTHILPEFIISFKTLPSLNGPQIDRVRLEKPVSPWIPIPALMAALSKILPHEPMKKIGQYRRSYIEHKISRREMIQGIRKFAGDKLLLMVLKDFEVQRQLGRAGGKWRRSLMDSSESKCGHTIPFLTFEKTEEDA